MIAGRHSTVPNQRRVPMGRDTLNFCKFRRKRQLLDETQKIDLTNAVS